MEGRRRKAAESTTAWRRLGSVVLLSFAIWTAAFAQPAMSGNERAAAIAPKIDPVALEAFVDGVVMTHVRSRNVTGVLVSVVSTSGVLLEKGYGTARPGPNGAVDPSLSMFRLGSLSKTFTYIAIMQLQAAGKIDLEADVNRYLPDDLRIPAEGFGPIKVRDLMVHSAGFEDSAIGHLFSTSPNGPSLEAYVRDRRPHRVRAPGSQVAYSNYSAVLLGAVVAHVSGRPFETYMEQQILRPLHMDHTTFRERLDAPDPRRVDTALASNFATGFAQRNGQAQPQPEVYLPQAAPAGAARSTARDMSRYMRMLLGEGAVDGVQIVPKTAFDVMADGGRSTRQPDPVGWSHGFMRWRYGSHYSLQHHGDLPPFLCNMVVLPDAGLAVFVAVNDTAGGQLYMQLPRMIFEEFVPNTKPIPPPAPPRALASQSHVLAGAYLPARRNFTTVERLAAAPFAAYVSVRKDGSVVIQGRRFVPIAPGLFQGADVRSANTVVTFSLDRRGRGRGFQSAGWAYERAEGLDDPRLLFATLAVAISLSVLAAFNLLRQRVGTGGRAERRYIALIGLALASWIGAVSFVAGVAAPMVVARSPAGLFGDYPSLGLVIAVGVAHLAALFTLFAAGSLFWLWRGHAWSTKRLLLHTTTTMSLCLLVVLMIRWHALLAPLILKSN